MKKSAEKRPRTNHKRSGKKQVNPRAQEILQQRIADALQAEMLKNKGQMPGEKRQREIAQQQLERAQAEGLIAADTDFGPANGISGEKPGLSGGTLFGGGSNSARKSVNKGRSQIYRPSRSGMYRPSRSQVNVPRKPSLRRTGRSSSRPRSAAPGGNSGLQLPDLTGGKGAMGSPEQLQRQLQRLLK